MWIHGLEECKTGDVEDLLPAKDPTICRWCTIIWTIY